MSIVNTGRKMSPESIEKIRQANIGRPSKLKGRKLPEETKAKISKSKIGHKVSIQTRKKLSKAHKGKKLSDEHINKIKHRMRTNHPNKGKKLSVATKAKISKNSKAKRRVKNISTGKIFNSIQEAAKFYNISHTHIGCVCSGKRSTSGGYVWKAVS